MKTILKVTFLVGTIATFISCNATFNASEAMETQQNRNAVYQEIISNPAQFNELLDLAANNEMAKKTLMQNHMQMMESGKMEAMMKKNPEMKEKMKKMMKEMMEKIHDDPEMMEKMKQHMDKSKKEGEKHKEHKQKP